MTVEEFTESLARDVYRFKSFWLENQQQEPESFPKEMNEGDWYDQFLIYMGVSEQE